MLEGQLADFVLADIFQLLALTKKSGELIVSDAQAEGRIVVRSGEVTFATADSRRLALGARLVAGGLADDECLVRLAARQRADGPLGVLRALSEDEDISDDTLTELVRAEVEDAIFALRGWTEGDFRFEAGEDTEIPTAATFAGEQLIGDAEALMTEWAAVADRLPEQDAVLSLNPQPPAPPQFDATAWRVIAHVDGRRSVRDLIDLVGGKAFATTCAIADLVDAGVLEAGRRGTGTIARAESRRDILRRLERELGGSAPTPAPAGKPDDVAPPPAPVAEEPEPGPSVTPEPELETTPDPEIAPEPEPEPAPEPAAAPLAVDRSAFARELASLGLEDGPSAPPPTPAAKATTAAPAPETQEGAGEGVGQPAEQAKLSRDDDVSKGMLLRLIDGVKGA